MRDTDRDWKEYGNFEPYYGVLTHDRFLQRNLTEATLQEFWQTGRDSMGSLWAEFERIFGARHPKSALDFGCGVGRLTRAMAELSESATGVDISEGMLAEARKSAPSNVTFTSTIPAGPFDWINSYIVFQHIPPKRGYQLLGNLLDVAAPSCALTLHFGFFKDPSALSEHGLRGIEYGTWDGEEI